MFVLLKIKLTIFFLTYFNGSCSYVKEIPAGLSSITRTTMGEPRAPMCKNRLNYEFYPKPRLAAWRYKPRNLNNSNK